MSNNKNLHRAHRVRNDEFYTQLSDIKKELCHYTNHFHGKVVYCNADDPASSNFFRYFKTNFHDLGLKKLLTSSYSSRYSQLFETDDNSRAVSSEFDGEIHTVNQLKGNGDFRSGECIDLLKQADVVVTNPPFSLIREYIIQLMEYDKQFLIIGPVSIIGYKEISPLIKDNRIWIGVSMKSGAEFEVPDERKLVKFGNSLWFTNIDHESWPRPLPLTKKYSPEEYPSYNNYDAIEVSKVADIPMDYDGEMGVPISFLEKYNPKQFEIIRFRKGDDNKDLQYDGNYPFNRIIIKAHK